MNNFDTSTWKEFLVKDLFHFENPKGKLTTKDLIEGNDIPYIAAKKTNNGVGKMCSRTNIPDDQVMKGNCIVFVQQGDGSAGYTTYQKDDFYAISCVTCGYIDGIMNESIGLFLVSVLDKNKAFYNHSNSWSGDKLLNTKILLPATETHEPDWNYMQERIAELERERIAELEQYLIATGLNDYELTEKDKQILATKLTDGGASQSSESGSGCWKEARKFKLVDIANVSYGTKFDKNKMSHVSPKINFVSRTAINNGVSDCVDECGVEPFMAGTITLALGGSIGSCFIQEKPYYTGQNVGVIELPTFVTDKAKIYFVGVLQKECKAQFTAFANEINRYLKTTLSVLLPVTSNGQPDWDFMDKYIHAIEKVAIADVVKYKDKVITKTKAMVQQPSL